MVHHFFGTKERLFRASLELPFDPSLIAKALDARPGDEGRTLVRGVLQIWHQPEIRERFTAMLRAAVTHDHARAALRDVLTTQILSVLVDRMDDEDAPLRAALVGSQMAGLALTRLVMEVEPLATIDDEVLVEAIGPNVQRYLTGDLTGRR
jgi:AcrR family transcriptional regulator